MNNRSHILVIEHDESYHLLIRMTLRSQYQVTIVRSPAEALALRPLSRFALILLSAVLPDRECSEVCNEMVLVGDIGKTPIIVMTDPNLEAIHDMALNNLADDFLERPFDPLELLARVRKELKHAEKEEVEEVIRSGGLELNLTRKRVYWTREKRREITLTALQFRMLKFFVTNPGRVVSREEIIQETWGRSDVLIRTVDTHICNLRSKLNLEEIKIAAVHGAGYCFASDESPATWFRPSA